MERMMQMASAEDMMDLAIKANSRHGFETGAANYAQAAWDKVLRFDYDQVTSLMGTYKTNKDDFWGKLYKTVFHDG